MTAASFLQVDEVPVGTMQLNVKYGHLKTQNIKCQQDLLDEHLRLLDVEKMSLGYHKELVDLKDLSCAKGGESMDKVPPPVEEVPPPPAAKESKPVAMDICGSSCAE